MSNAIDFPGGKPTNSNYNSSGNDGLPTTSKVSNNVNSGKGHPLTHNQVILSYWKKKTRHPSIGLQLSSRKPIQAKMA